MECVHCQGKCTKKGKIKNVQRYICKCCGKTQQKVYIKPRIPVEKYDWVRQLNNEGCGISSIGRLLHVAKSSVQRIIICIAHSIQIPAYHEYNQVYEIDELRSYCGNKKNESWLMYAINRITGQVIDFQVGRRTKSYFKDPS
jgi:transposase-like protein